MTSYSVCGVDRSILGQPWHWRGTATDGRDDALVPDDLVTQLLKGRIDVTSTPGAGAVFTITFPSGSAD